MSDGDALGPWMVWIDGFGGVWLSFAPQVTLGSVLHGQPHHVGLMADLLPRHASIMREGDWYILVAHGPVRVNDRPINGYHVIGRNDVAELGPRVRLQFRWPQPISNSVRLEIVSSHRTLPPAKALVLVDRVCLIGPTRDCHAVVPHWSSQVAFFSRDGQLWVHGPEDLLVSGSGAARSAPLQPPCRVVGRDFSFFIEPLPQ